MASQEVKLVRYDQARIALQSARNVDEAKSIRDQAIALKAYAIQVKNAGDTPPSTTMAEI